MRANTTEMDALAGTSSFRKPPSWWETAEASFDMMSATGLTTSKYNYETKAIGEQADKLSELDPENAELYEGVKSFSTKQLGLYEKYYNEGTLDAYIGERDWRKRAIVAYFDGTKRFGIGGIEDAEAKSKEMAKADYLKANEVLSRSDSFTAELAGGMAASMKDPVNLMLLPFGGTVVKGAGQSVLGTAARAAGVEMGLAAIAEPIIQVSEYNWKQELGIKYTVKDAAFNAIASIGGAGLLRGAGSATIDIAAPMIAKRKAGMMDLTEEGRAKLKEIDPELSDDYEQIIKGSLSDDISEHLDNMNRIETGDDIVIKTPNKKGEELKNTPPVKEHTEKIEVDIPEPTYIEKVTRNLIRNTKNTKLHSKILEIGQRVADHSEGMFDAEEVIDDILSGSLKGMKKESTSQTYGVSNNNFDSMTTRRTENKIDKTEYVTEKEAARILSGRATENDLKKLDAAVESRMQNERELYEAELAFGDAEGYNIKRDGGTNIIVGADEEGNAIVRSYDDMMDEANEELNILNAIEECILL